MSFQTNASHRSIGAYVACAHNDMAMVRSIYQGVWAHGVDLQLQVENFLVGQDPRRATARAVEAAAVVVLYLSQNSHDADGKLKYELRFVRSLSDGKAVIGVIGDQSPILKELQDVREWVSLVDGKGYGELTKKLIALSKKSGLQLSSHSDSVSGPVQMFISYSHRDEQYRDELLSHLSSLKREGVIEVWHDRRLEPGASVDAATESHLSRADIVIFLVSPDFIASDYCFSKEVLRALQGHAWGRSLVIPVIARPTDWRRTPFGGLLALPRDGKPISTWHDRDEAFLDVIVGIRRLLESRRHVEGHE